MLEVKNLTKIYNMRSGVQVRALDNVSLAFPEKGMVFLLGKSGSGKSTLLNVCGGLDAPTQGEIIIKGRSSKDFSAEDFDSYRNTFVGFIFQEYNILNEFSVEDNIALALELQGKPKDKALIDSLLSQVQLQNFAKRKPNTLSGGQKQRVAIARALVKSPEVIMADEPTGALDSNTGKQVFDTLKELSKDKLIIVVSHDREFAELYADRIIELQDGKVISDVTKNSTPATKASANYNIVGDDTLLIPSGKSLTTADLKAINGFLSQSQQDILICRNSKDNTNIKKLIKINDDNSQDNFVPIANQPQQRQYTAEESKFVRSKLPLRHALRIGASNIKAKPVRFTFTVLLSILSFVMFGLFSCVMFFDAVKVNAYSLAQSNAQYLAVAKTYEQTVTNYYPDETYSSISNKATNLTTADIDALKAKYNVIPVYMSAKRSSSIQISNLTVKSNQTFYTNSVYGIIDGDSIQYTIGTAPQDNEIAISRYLYDCIKTGTLYDSDNRVIVVANNSVDNIVLSIFGTYYKVSGVYEQQTIDSKYNVDMNTQLAYEWNTALSNDFYAYIAINSNTYQQLSQHIDGLNKDDVQHTQQMDIYFSDNMPTIQYNGNSYDFTSNQFVVAQSATYYNNNGQKVKGEIPLNNITLHYNTYMNIVSDKLNAITVSPDDQEATKQKGAATDALNRFYQHYNIDYAEFDSDISTIMQFINTYGNGFAPNVTINNITFNVGGFTNSYVCLLNKNDYDSLKTNSVNLGCSVTEYSTDYNTSEMSSTIYQGAFINIDGKSGEQLQALLKDTTTPHDHSTYQYSNSLIDQISLITYAIELFSGVFLYLGIGLAILAMLLLFNFISVSVANKKREIGILRAVGARGTDVFRIFFSESAIIVAICTVASLIATAVLSATINGTLSGRVGTSLSLFVFSWVTIAMVVGIAILTAFVATFLPVYNASRKKPVETIRSN